MQTVSRESLFELHDGVVCDRPNASSMSNAGVASYGAWHPVELYMHRVVSRPSLLCPLKLRTAPWQVGCFPNGSCSNVEHCHRHRVGGHTRGCDGGGRRSRYLGSGRARRYEIARQARPTPFRCLPADQQSSPDAAVACLQRAACASPVCALVARTDATRLWARGLCLAPAP